jgi:hypothetical protein
MVIREATKKHFLDTKDLEINGDRKSNQELMVSLQGAKTILHRVSVSIKNAWFVGFHLWMKIII